MNQTDPIADMLTRLRKANSIRAEVVQMPYSKLKDEIARILKREGFIKDCTTEGGGAFKVLRLYLKFDADRVPVIRGWDCHRQHFERRAF
jgi:small subunit ribosomal protein S8